MPCELFNRAYAGGVFVIETKDGDFIEIRSASPWGRAAGSSLLSPTPDALPASPEQRLIIRSGWLPDEEAPDRPDPRTWGARGWEALEEALSRHLAGTGPRILIRPAWTDVISDTPSCIRFLDLREQWGGLERLGLLLDPAAMLAPSMMPTAEDHVRRILEMVAGREGVDGVVASNVEVREGVPRHAPLHRGAIDAQRLSALYRGLVPASIPIILTGGEAEVQRRAIE